MQRRAAVVLPVLLVAVAGAIWAFRGGPGGGEDPVLRGPPEIPAPGTEEKVRYFYRLFTSGSQTVVAGRRIPEWQLFGERGLRSLGRPALSFLISKERFPGYRATPTDLSNVLRLLREWPEAGQREELYPFLLHWLDPAKVPPPAAGTDWSEDLRRKIFALFVLFPDARAVPACMEELRHGKHEKNDLRPAALATLLALGEGGRLATVYESLPPDEEEPEVFHRFLAVKKLHALASRARPARMRRQVVELRPALHRALESEHSLERIYAAATLLRLGHGSMSERLLEEAEREEEAAAWDAVRLLALENGHPAARKLCLEELEAKQRRVGFYTALDLLATVWVDEPEIRSVVFGYLDDSTWLEDPRFLHRLLRADRERVVDFLRKQIQGEDRARRDAALRFVMQEAVREAGPWILELLQEAADDRERVRYYQALIALRDPVAVPMLRAELVESKSTDLHRLAVGALLDSGDDEALEELSDLLREGDRVVQENLFSRSVARGREGVPEALVPAVLSVVRSPAGEGARITALYVLRARGSLDGVEEGLVEAYRREGSRRVAEEIARVLVELAHR